MIFYDFEVFEYDWLVVFIFSNGNEKIIVNDSDMLTKFYEENKNEIYVGYNNVSYDQYIFKGIMLGLNPKRISEHIIDNEKPGWSFSGNFNKIKMINYDVHENLPNSLKYYEGGLGHNIKESSVDFKLKRKLTNEEIKETIKYCRHDVIETIELFKLLIDKFKVKVDLIKLNKCSPTKMSKSSTSLAMMMLGCNGKKFDDEWDLFLPPDLNIKKYTQVVDWFMNEENHVRKKEVPKKSGKGTKLVDTALEINVAGIDVTFAWGGCHGAIPYYSGEGEYLMIDVTSLYPYIMINYDLLSRAISENGKQKYIDFVLTRKKLKHSDNPKDKAYSNSLKPTINGVYGKSGEVGNEMCDLRNNHLVCMFGQLLILELIENLEDVCDVIQVNTDGVLVKLRKSDDFDIIDDICYEWEKRHNLELDFDPYKRIYQKDVNNYIAEDFNGKIKRKGASFKKQPLYNRIACNLASDGKIDYFLNGTSVNDIVENCKTLVDLQFICHASRKYDGLCTVDENGNKEMLPYKTVRVFATKEDGVGIYKFKGDSLSKVPSTPTKCKIVNEDITNMPIPEWIDKEWYKEYIRKQINRVLHGEKENEYEFIY